MATQDNVILEWRLNRTADELRGRAKQTMIAGATIIGAGAVASLVTYASAGSCSCSGPVGGPRPTSERSAS